MLGRAAAALDLLNVLLLLSIQKLFTDTSYFLSLCHKVLLSLFKGCLVSVRSGTQREDVL